MKPDSRYTQFKNVDDTAKKINACLRNLKARKGFNVSRGDFMRYLIDQYYKKHILKESTDS